MTDTEKIRKRYSALLYKADAFSEQEAEGFFSTLCENNKKEHCFWDDIDYTDIKRTSWAVAEHYYRLKTIICGFSEKRLQDKEYIRKIFGAIKFWADNDFHNPNWWYNDIGTPKAFGEIGIMLYDALDDTQRTVVAKITAQGSANVRPMALINGENITYWTGANLLWGAVNTINHALLTNDDECLRKGTELAHRELVVGNREGIQYDGSFFQHGRLLYSGGYGRSFANDIATLAYIFDGTQYQFSKEKLEIFLKHILDGLRCMTVGAFLDWQSMGREYVRPGAISVGSLRNTLKLMTETQDMPRSDEISGYLSEICGSKKEDFTKYFENAHMLCHQSNGIYVGTRFITESLCAAEICNSENILGANLAYGTTTCIMKNGDEYYDIAPVWNYSKIPGTTSRNETDAELSSHTAWRENITVGASDGRQVGKRAVIFQNVKHNGIEYVCADFAFEGGFVCLGGGIKATDGKDRAIITTVDQRRAGKGMHGTDNAFFTDGICYTTLDGKKLHSTVERVYGSWKRNNLCFPDSSEVSEEMLTLEIHHEKGKQSSYAYLISGENSKPEITVLCNNGDVQAILLPDSTLMAVFYKKASIEYNGKVITKDAGIYIE